MAKSINLTPGQRRIRAQLAAATRWANEDPLEQARILQNAIWQKYLDEVDPRRVLTEAERLRRATSARRAHILRAALASSIARSKNKKAAPKTSDERLRAIAHEPEAIR